MREITNGKLNMPKKRIASRRSGIITVPLEQEHCVKLEKHPKTTEDESIIREALRKNEFLTIFLDNKRLQIFIDCMCKQSTYKNQIIFNQGDAGCYLYISIQGKYEIIADKQTVAVFDDVRIFGELAILHNAKRQTTVKALTEGKVWMLDCLTFNSLIIQSGIDEQKEIVSLLKDMPKLNDGAVERLYEIANLLQAEFFDTGTEIVKKGNVGDKLYIIRTGSVTVTTENKSIRLHKGQFFGVLNHFPCDSGKLIIIADSPGVDCLILSKQQAMNHFGGFGRVVDKPPNLKVEQQTASTSTEEPSDYRNLRLSDLKNLKTLGTGGFGKVDLVQHATNKRLVFVLKSVKISSITRPSHREQIFNEKNLQMFCSSPFIVRLHRTFQDTTCLYFLLEFCAGGDLWHLMHKQKKQHFDERSAQFYAACILEGLAYLHRHNIVYRDLKPENVVVSKSGYVKLTDFGFTKKLNANETTNSFVGTAEYMAPVIILNKKGYNTSVDYWSFGVLIFELLAGRTPFKSPDSLSTYKLILRGIEHVEFPRIISSRAKSIIRKLCRSSPEERLGCNGDGVKDLKCHSWFTGFNWEKLIRRQVKAPFTPHLRNNVDTRYFDNIQSKTHKIL